MKYLNAWILFIALSFSILACRSTWHVADTEQANYRFSKNEKLSEPEIDSLIAPYRKSLTAEMSEVIAYAEKSMRKHKPESALGNWIADLLMEEAEAESDHTIDFAVQNYGGLRLTEIPKGPITKGKIYELFPFENQLVIVHIPYKEMMMFLDKIANSRGWPVSDGLQMKISEGKASEIRIGGEAIQENRVYQVAMPDYIANGGDASFFLKDLKREEFGLLIRDAIIRNARAKNKQGIKITSDIYNRIN